MENLAQKTRLTFYAVLFTGILLLFSSVYFLIFLFGKLKLLWSSVAGKLETICGCANHLVFSNHPYLFSFLMISFFIIFSFAFIVIYKAVVLRRKTSKFIKNSLQYKRTHLSGKLKRVVNKIGLEGSVIELKESGLNVFCYGLFVPKVCILSRFIHNFSEEELQAILLHEQHHLLSYDPLKFYIIKIISTMFFFVPFLEYFSKKFFALSEMAADDWVIKKMKEKSSLARVVYKTLEMSERMALGQGLIVPLFDDITEERVNKLIDDKYVLNIKLLSSRLVVFLGVFIFSISAYSFLVLTGDNVIAMHDNNLCFMKQNKEHDSCIMDSNNGLCEMEEGAGELEYFVCKEK